ncbi:unnamed protein product, partial [Nesidiocoris tenuis]
MSPPPRAGRAPPRPAPGPPADGGPRAGSRGYVCFAHDCYRPEFHKIVSAQKCNDRPRGRPKGAARVRGHTNTHTHTHSPIHSINYRHSTILNINKTLICTHSQSITKGRFILHIFCWHNHQVGYPSTRFFNVGDGLMTSVLPLEVRVDPSHISPSGNLTLRCTALVATVFRKSVEVILGPRTSEPVPERAYFWNSELIMRVHQALPSRWPPGGLATSPS